MDRVTFVELVRRAERLIGTPEIIIRFIPEERRCVAKPLANILCGTLFLTDRPLTTIRYASMHEVGHISSFVKRLPVRVGYHNDYWTLTQHDYRSLQEVREMPPHEFITLIPEMIAIVSETLADLEVVARQELRQSYKDWAVAELTRMPAPVDSHSMLSRIAGLARLETVSKRAHLNLDVPHDSSQRKESLMRILSPLSIDSSPKDVKKANEQVIRWYVRGVSDEGG